MSSSVGRLPVAGYDRAAEDPHLRVLFRRRYTYGPVTDNAQSVFELSQIENLPGIEAEL